MFLVLMDYYNIVMIAIRWQVEELVSTQFIET